MRKKLEKIMDPYRNKILPAPFGLDNDKQMCFLNSLLQALASCPAFTGAILRGTHRRTRTEKILLEFIRNFLAYVPGDSEIPYPVFYGYAKKILHSLKWDLRERNEKKMIPAFGLSQESVSETFILLMEVLSRNLTSLFMHLFQCKLTCMRCEKIVSKTEDRGYICNLFHLSNNVSEDFSQKMFFSTNDGKWEKKFSEEVYFRCSEVSDYKCPNCRQKTLVLRSEILVLVPEILICSFNKYNINGGSDGDSAIYFPKRLYFPAEDGGTLVYMLVGQIEHAGSLAGGHYWTRALRADKKTYLFNDTYVAPSHFLPTPETYLVIYHFLHHAGPG